MFAYVLHYGKQSRDHKPTRFCQNGNFVDLDFQHKPELKSKKPQLFLNKSPRVMLQG